MISASLPVRTRTASLRHATIWLYGLVLTAVILFTYFVPRGDGDVAVVVSPFSSRAEAALTVARANGQIVDVARWPFIVLAHAGMNIATEKAGGARFVTRLYDAGAWLVFSPGIAAGCIKRD